MSSAHISEPAAGAEFDAWVDQLVIWGQQQGVETATLSYGDDPEHVGDLRMPAQPTNKPLIITIHGGAFRSRYKRNNTEALAIDLTLAGFPTWNVEYRRTGNGGGPYTTTADLKQAYDFITRRPEFETRPVFILGHSSGGILALWLARHRPNQAVIALSSICDMTELSQTAKGPYSEFMGGTPNQAPEAFDYFSVTASNEMSPFHLLGCGIHDTEARKNQNETYLHQLHENQTAAAYLEVECGHFGLLDPAHASWAPIRAEIEKLAETHARTELRPAIATESGATRDPDRFLVDWSQYYADGLKKREELIEAGLLLKSTSYGPDPAHLVEVYNTDTEKAKPALILFHGGGFREGHPYFYADLVPDWIEQDVAVVLPGYRIYPHAMYPDSGYDAERAVAWVYRHAEELGIDPDQIYFGGHSVGADLAAQLTFQSTWQEAHGLPRNVIKGASLSSGVYDYRDGAFGIAIDETRADEASIVQHISNTSPEVAIGWSDNELNTTTMDPTWFDRCAHRLIAVLHQYGHRPKEALLSNYNHIETNLALGQAASPLFQATKQLIRSEPHAKS